MKKYYETLDYESKERLFSIMRDLGRISDDLYQEARKYYPPYGTIPVGGEHFDKILKAEIVSTYLRSLRNGETPENSKEITIKNRNEFVKKWNYSRKDYQVHRSETMYNSYIDDIHRLIIKFL